jgi:hypothetical protein
MNFIETIHKEVKMQPLQRADELQNETRVIVLVGPPKMGKTVAACTASNFTPDELPAKEKVNLDDTLVIQFDTNGIESARQLGLNPYVIDLSTVVDLAELTTKLREAFDTAYEFAKAGPNRRIILDTLTTLNTRLVVGLQKQFPDQKQIGQLYGKLLSINTNLAARFTGIPGVMLIAIGHTKLVGGLMGDEEAMELRAKASNLGSGDIVLDMPGKGGNFWKGAASAVWPVLRQKDKHVILPYGGKNFEGGCRFHGLDAAGEPAHLKKLFAKVGIK